jgi:hypothetical protein
MSGGNPKAESRIKYDVVMTQKSGPPRPPVCDIGVMG